MTKYLPHNLMMLFEPRPPIEHLPPMEKRKMPSLSGLSEFTTRFENPNDVEYPHIEDNTGIVPLLSEMKEKKRKLKQEQELEKLAKLSKEWDPNANPKATSDAYLTLFVGRLGYDVDESLLRSEFEPYGSIKSVVIVRDQDSGKSSGYGFVEFEREKDMQVAYREADGKKINDRRIVVDVERGRTVKDWKPRRLGGGLGGSRMGADAVNVKYSGRHHPWEKQQQPVTSDGYGGHRDGGYRGGGGGGGFDRGYNRGGGGGSYRGGGGRDYDRPRDDYRSRGPPRDYDRPYDRHGGGDDRRRDYDRPPRDDRRRDDGGYGNGAPRDYDRRERDRGGFDNRGGYDNRSGDRGGYDNRGGDDRRRDFEDRRR